MSGPLANLFARESTARERVEELLDHPGARVERIWGPVPAPSEIYDQDHDEWVVLLSGQAELELDGRAPLDLHPGDHLFIPAHLPHRVLSASADALWLALHFAPRVEAPSP